MCLSTKMRGDGEKFFPLENFGLCGKIKKMDKRYQPQKFEDKIYSLWKKSKAFAPKKTKRKKAFSIIMPPPNANAPLHIGHAMFITLEDIMARYHRMLGDNTLLLPGSDHAGILTQVVFERHLAKNGKDRFSLGRKKFFQQCLKFTKDNTKIMVKQFKKIGVSADWTRQKFTLNKDVSKQVLLTFVQMYKDGLAYRGKRLINWCPRCMTALSDLEVEHQEIKGKLYYIKYPLKIHSQITGQKRFLIVATTRPETLFGDTALAINPKDERYQEFIGQKALVPLINREIPIISDRSVDIEFGTGIVKITPAHDPRDWQVGLKYNLPIISVIGFDQKMTANAGKEFKGLTIKKAREKLVNQLKDSNLLIKGRNFIHAVGRCERCKTIIQPLVSQQWFLNTNLKLKIKNLKLKKTLGIKRASLKDLGLLAVKKKLITIIPSRFKKNYFNWLNNLHDWCISRQIWWGQQLPIWYCGTKGLSNLQKKMNPKLIKKQPRGCGHIIVSLKKPRKCPKCGNTHFIQDPDTFDCWFSSGQWPYNTLGYPKSSDYKKFYPTSTMETGYEILFFWVARMIMLGMYRTQQPPFKNVYLHGLVRDAFGQKMSKSKGNGINPLGVIAKYGADALRMSLIVGAGPGNDISVGEEKIKGYRNFTNKVWNIGRFIISYFPTKTVPFYTKNLKGLTLKDKKIVKKLNELIKTTTKNLNEYQFSPAGEDIYHFIWHEFADKYLESAKKRVKNKDLVVFSVLRHVFLTCLKLLHPFMPFVTEAVWQQMPKKYKKPLITSPWPKEKK